MKKNFLFRLIFSLLQGNILKDYAEIRLVFLVVRSRLNNVYDMHYSIRGA